MKNIFFVLFVFITIYSCNEDEEIKRDVPLFTVSSFTDSRDGEIYKTIKIGDQIWMAENLRYRLRLGYVDGCASYKEIMPDTNNVPIDKEKMKQNILDEKPELEVFDFSNPLFLIWTMYGGDSWFDSRSSNYNLSYTEFINNKIKNFIEIVPEAAQELIDLYDKHYNIMKKDTIVDFCKTTTDFDYIDKYGYLYTYEGALKAIPEGWRLPTDDDWKSLEKTLGMDISEINKLEEWRGVNEGDLLKDSINGIEFIALMSGGRFYGDFSYSSSRYDDVNYRNINLGTYFWSSTTYRENDSLTYGFTRVLRYNEDRIYRGTTSLLETLYSVRCIKNND